MSDNAEAAARRAAHGILAGVLFAIPECEKVHPRNRDGSAGWLTESCDRLTAYILTTETRLAAAEEALMAHKELSYRRGYLSGIQRVCAETNTEEAEDNNPDDELERIGLWLGEESARAKKAVDNAKRALAEPPGEGAGALIPGTGRGGHEGA